MRRALLAALWLASGCAPSRTALRLTAKLVEDGAPAYHAEPDPALAAQALPAQLKLLETLLASDPRNPRLLGLLAEGFAGYAFLFLEDEAPERARGAYRRALGYALRLAERRGLEGLDRLAPEALEAALRRAGKDDVPALYWAATAWAGWANLAKDDPAALSGLPRAARAMERVRELDPGFQFGGPDLFFGAYYASRPRLAGGDPDKAKAFFESALARGGRRFLTAQLFYARHYAVAVLDEELFRRLNQEVLAADAAALPQARLANEVAKLKAKRLLERTNELF